MSICDCTVISRLEISVKKGRGAIVLYSAYTINKQVPTGTQV